MALYKIASILVTSGILTSAGTLHRTDSAIFRGHSELTGYGDLTFTRLGPVSNPEPLASGTIREQVGLQVRMQDPCNLIYVMWEFFPTAQIRVSSKVNPGMSTSPQCGASGYTSLATYPIAAPALGVATNLRARVGDDNILRISVNGTIVMWVPLSGPAVELRGWCGVRSDNVSFEFTLRCSDIP